jgi:hypothetical protein
MRKRNRDPKEERRLKVFIDKLGPPREPTVKIYRIEPDGKQTRLGVMELEWFDEETLRKQFGAGTFLVRTVRSNGTYGPSRVLRIGPGPR